MVGDRRIIDTDAHFHEAREKLAKYFDEPLKSELFDRENPDYALNKLLASGSGDRFIGGRIQREGGYLKGDMEAEEVPAIMENLSLDSIILLSNQMLAFDHLYADDSRMVEVANAHADLMLNEVVDPDEGIYTMIVAPYDYPDETVDLIERVKDEEGVVGVCMEAAGPEPPFGNRKYDPIYDACEKHDLPVIFHAGGSSVDSFPVDGFGKFIETHTLGFLWSVTAQITSVVIQGVPEKFPDLDIVFQECGLFWIPMMMNRLDIEYMKRRSEAPLLTKRPSEYIEEFYYSTQPLEVPRDESHLEQVIEMIGGVDQIMYASDYPHWDYDDPSVIDDLSFLSDAEKQQIFSGTAEEVFGI